MRLGEADFRRGQYPSNNHQQRRAFDRNTPHGLIGPHGRNSGGIDDRSRECQLVERIGQPEHVTVIGQELTHGLQRRCSLGIGDDAARQFRTSAGRVILANLPSAGRGPAQRDNGIGQRTNDLRLAFQTGRRTVYRGLDNRFRRRNLAWSAGATGPTRQLTGCSAATGRQND